MMFFRQCTSTRSGTTFLLYCWGLLLLGSSCYDTATPLPTCGSRGIGKPYDMRLLLAAVTLKINRGTYGGRYEYLLHQVPYFTTSTH